MRTAAKFGFFVAAILAMAPAKSAQAAPLSFVNVSVLTSNCVFNITCNVPVTDSVGTIAVSPLLWTGSARLLTRTFSGAAGTPGAGKTFYEYRVDLTQAVSSGEAPCVTDIAVDFGPVTKLQYNGRGPLDDVYVVNRGGPGTIGLFAVEQTGNIITFTFNEPICAGPSAGNGHSSHFIGLASSVPPKSISAKVGVPGLLPVDVKARGPDYRGGSHRP